MQIHSIQLSDGTVISSGGGLPAIEKVRLTQKCNTQQELCFGSVCASMLELTLLCQDGQLPLSAGDKVELFDEAGKLGVFFVETSTRKAKGVYEITAYDCLRKLDQPIDGWLSSLDQWPYDLEVFAQMVCNACGLQFQKKDMLCGDYRVERFSGTSITGRALMGWIAQASATFCRAVDEQTVELAWYENSDLVYKPTGQRYYYQDGFQHADDQVQRVGQVVVYRGNEDVGVCYPENGTNAYGIEANPLLQSATKEGAWGVAYNLYNRLLKIAYTPGEIRVPSHLGIAPGVRVEVEDEKGNSYSLYVMERRRSGGQDILSCTGSTTRQQADVIERTQVNVLSGKVQKLKIDVGGLESEMSQTQQTQEYMRSRLSQTDSNFSMLVEKSILAQQGLEGANRQIAQLKSQVTFDMDSQQAKITAMKETLENGVSKVTTETGYTFDSDGLKIAKSGEDMENTLDNTGMYVRRGGEDILTANNVGVVAKNAHIQTYLIIGQQGGRSRLEDYGAGRTGCFWIGG